MEKRKILVTGATGFIGSHLVKKLLDGSSDIGCLIRPNSDITSFPLNNSNLKFFRTENNAQSIEQILRNFSPDLIYHLATNYIANHSSEQIGPLIESNVLFGAYLLQGMAESELKNLVVTGTSWQYNQSGEYSPANLYSATKQAFQDICTYYSNNHGINSIFLQLFDTFGPFDNRPKLFSLLNKTAESGETLEMSPGEQILDLIYIDDVIEALLQAGQLLLNQSVEGLKVFAARGPEGNTLKQVVRIYEETTQTHLNISWGAKPYREGQIMNPWQGENSLPQWKAKISLVDGIKKMIQINESKQGFFE